jgi:hypothetical protein
MPSISCKPSDAKDVSLAILSNKKTTEKVVFSIRVRYGKTIATNDSPAILPQKKKCKTKFLIRYCKAIEQLQSWQCKGRIPRNCVKQNNDVKVVFAIWVHYVL